MKRFYFTYLLSMSNQKNDSHVIVSIPLAIPFGPQPLNTTFDDSPVLHDQQLVLVDPVQTRYVLQGILVQE